MTLFTDKAPWIINLLKADFGLTTDDAVAIVANIGHESAGFRHFQEIKPTVPGSKGGFGWCQWTGPRRREFEAYCKRNKLDPFSDRANYGFLFVELKGTEKGALPAVRMAQGLEAKVAAFERKFERAGVINMPSRMKYAEAALAAWKATPGARPPYALEKPVPLDAAPEIPPQNSPQNPPEIIPEQKQGVIKTMIRGKQKAWLAFLIPVGVAVAIKGLKAAGIEVLDVSAFETGVIAILTALGVYQVPNKA